MAGSTVGVIKRLFDRPIVGDLTGYGALLSPDVERIGPWAIAWSDATAFLN